MISRYGTVNKGEGVSFEGIMDEYPLDSSTNSAYQAAADLTTSLANYDPDTSASRVVLEIQDEPSSVSATKVMRSLLTQKPNIQRSAAKASPERLIPPRMRTRVERVRQRAREWRLAHPGAKVSIRAGFDRAQSKNPPPTPRVAGITEMHQGPFSSGTFLTRNFYQGTSGKSWLLAYAGAMRDPAVRYPDHGSDGRGAIRLYAQDDARGTMVSLGTFAAPAGTGSLRILARQGDKLILTSAQGTRFQFDLGTHRITAQ